MRTDEELGAIATKGKEPVFFAVAKEGAGVVETFLGLLHLIWQTIDEGCDLTRLIGVDGREVLGAVARHLNTHGPLDSLLAKSLGGSYRPLPQLAPGVGRRDASPSPSAVPTPAMFELHPTELPRKVP